MSTCRAGCDVCAALPQALAGQLVTSIESPRLAIRAHNWPKGVSGGHLCLNAASVAGKGVGAEHALEPDEAIALELLHLLGGDGVGALQFGRGRSRHGAWMRFSCPRGPPGKLTVTTSSLKAAQNEPSSVPPLDQPSRIPQLPRPEPLEYPTP